MNPKEEEAERLPNRRPCLLFSCLGHSNRRASFATIGNPLNLLDPSGHYAVDFGGDDEAGTNPFEEEMPTRSGDDYAQASWDRMMWSMWTEEEELAEAYRNEVAPYLTTGWRPGGEWENWAATEPLADAFTYDRVEALAFIWATGMVQQNDDGAFSIRDWSGFPDGVPRPTGPFRLRQGQEYEQARSLANNTNKALHRADPSFSGQQIHEIHPVKFGGSPVDMSNKVALPRSLHYQVTSWWNAVQRWVEKGQ